MNGYEKSRKVNNAMPSPTSLSRPNDDLLRIEWDDGLVSDLKISMLRAQCPCATCREKRQAAPSPTAGTPGAPALTVLDVRETLPPRIESMRPVGNYAYAIRFNDGHDTGIYSLTFLRQLCET